MSETLEERLTRSLDHQAGGLHDAPFTVDDVRGRARTIQRRRRGVAAGMVAAVAAIALPVALLSGPGNDRSDGVDPAPEPVVSGASVLRAGGALTLPDGSRVRPDLPPDVTDVAVLTDGRIVAPVNRSGGVIRVLSPEGALLADHPVEMTGITMGDGARTVAWVDADGTIQVLESGVDEPVAFPGIPVPEYGAVTVHAVLGADCAGGGCTVLVSDAELTTHRVTLDGATPLQTSVPLQVEAVSPDGATWAVSLKRGANEMHGCAALYDVASDAVTVRNCDTSLLSFSPDGQHLLATRSDGGSFLGEPRILDTDLREVGRITAPGEGVVSSAGWEDPSHLLVSTAAFDGSAWSLVRVGLDGETDQVLVPPFGGALPETRKEFHITG